MDEDMTNTNEELPTEPQDQQGETLFPDEHLQTSFDFSDIEAPVELKPRPVLTPSVPLLPSEMPPDLDRDRPARRPIVARWVYVAAGVVFAVVLLIVAAAVWISVSRTVTVPQVTGVSLEVARDRLEKVGLEVQVGERRFSAEPQGEVLEQTPGSGTTAAKGDKVVLVVSAGTEEVVMPDVVGDSIAIAQSALEDKGLAVVVETVASDQPSDTVLSTNPAAGAVVRSGDVVRVQVASPQLGGGSVQPYQLSGVQITVDPAPLAGQTPDITMEVARRLRALLEASGATVNVLRTGTATATSEPDRAAAALRTTPHVSVGLSAIESGVGGRVVGVPSIVATGTAQLDSLSSQLTAQLSANAPPSTTTSLTIDPVLGGVPAPWVRISLGSFGDAADRAAFADPTWADRVAQSIYTAIGEVFGSGVGQ